MSDVVDCRRCGLVKRHGEQEECNQFMDDVLHAIECECQECLEKVEEK